MDNPYDAAATAALNARRHRAVEGWVRQKVLTDTFRDLSQASTGMKLAAGHYELMSSVSPLAIARALPR